MLDLQALGGRLIAENAALVLFSCQEVGMACRTGAQRRRIAFHEGAARYTAICASASPGMRLLERAGSRTFIVGRSRIRGW